MSTLRSTHSLLRQAVRFGRAASRPISGKASSGAYRSARPLLLGAITAGALGYGAYKTFPEGARDTLKFIQPMKVHAANVPQSQPSVYSQGKDHAVYLWIHLKPTANSREVARSVAKLQKYVDQVVDPSMRDEDDEIWAGVGFGPNFYGQVAGKTRKNFTYPYRKGALGEMPSSGGDVFIHAKSNQVSKLFELANVVLRGLPKDSVASYEDIYSFVYQNGRDLSGFIDGTENPADDDSRQSVAVEKETGGSYVITQKWLHKLDVIHTEKDKTLEGWVGRQKGDSTELSRKSITSHVARMTGGSAFNQAKKFEIVRQSMPFGSHAGGAGLFFIGYAASPENFEFMLDRMVGAGGDGHSDDIMKVTTNVKGTYWYFPGAQELKKLE
ncbi:dye-decolorizing peroxidase YfeX-like [Haliotis rufescens]|uniref:dye-decolorizing peroxidase YfeX-like n=1 Tax=Haliotis rufescens TaxID=6454 RepID=UPI00201E7F48|nr:dye-decolorizing peroxidase YfeX-like [Haliotis rufescens]